jgi:hypothetical protein
VNISEAKSILLLYRPGTADAEDPQMAEALALAKVNPELTAWLDTHCAAQQALRAKFRQIAVPAGLKEQIISEHAASKRTISKRPAMQLVSVAILLLLTAALAFLWFPRRPLTPENTLAFYQRDMVSQALRGYSMDLMTNDVAPIRTYLSQSHAPADFNLPSSLQKAALTGCAVEEWQGAKVSLICFRTGKPLVPGAASDLWLFVVDRGSIKDAPSVTTPQFAKINRLITATWTDGNKLYLLGSEGEEQDIKQYLPPMSRSG